MLNAVRQDLLHSRGMGTASEVVVGGCSAGGMAVYLHCDSWASEIATVNSNTHTVCLADSGWFPLVPDSAGFPSTWFNGVWEGGFNFHNSSAALHPECLAHFNATMQWQCVMPEISASYTRTPLFIFQSRYDSFQIFNMERCIPMPPDPKSPCSDGVVTLWGDLVRDGVVGYLKGPLGSAAGSAAFVDSCYHHCGTWADFDEIRSWGNGNVTGSEAFGLWHAKPRAALYEQDTAYPCLGALCCGAHGPDGIAAEIL